MTTINNPNIFSYQGDSNHSQPAKKSEMDEMEELFFKTIGDTNKVIEQNNQNQSKPYNVTDDLLGSLNPIVGETIKKSEEIAQRPPSENTIQNQKPGSNHETPDLQTISQKLDQIDDILTQITQNV